MAGNCPNEDCHKRVNEIHDAVFKDKEGSCRFDIKQIKLCLVKFVQKKDLFKWLITFIIIIGIPVSITFINVWAEDKALPHKYAKKDKVSEVETRVIRLEEKYENITAQLKNLSKKQDDNTKAVLEAIKEIKKEE